MGVSGTNLIAFQRIALNIADRMINYPGAISRISIEEGQG